MVITTATTENPGHESRLLIFAAFAGLAAIGSSRHAICPARPKPGPEVPRPEAVLSFETLYGENCAGCHGKTGENGPATDLANPEYEALIDDASLRDVIANGEKGTLMPAFGMRGGGPLTDAQIDGIIAGHARAMEEGECLRRGDTPPPYKAAHPGDIGKGQAFTPPHVRAAMAPTRNSLASAGSILDGSFLASINEQTMRTTILAGRPDIGEPDWRGPYPGASHDRRWRLQT